LKRPTKNEIAFPPTILRGERPLKEKGKREPEAFLREAGKGFALWVSYERLCTPSVAGHEYR